VALSDIDRQLLKRCLGRKPNAWQDFVDRYMGLVVHVVQHTARARSIRLTPEDRDDLCSEVFLAFIKDNFAVLRHFRGQSSLATYLTVIARRVVVKKMLKRNMVDRLSSSALAEAEAGDNPEARIGDREEVERLLDELDTDEAEIVRMYHLDGKSYHEISTELGVPENSLGPMLSRARRKMQQARADHAAS
jgi:RNA polymerase sigma-70 factor (ECF subfamily)